MLGVFPALPMVRRERTGGIKNEMPSARDRFGRPVFSLRVSSLARHLAAFEVPTKMTTNKRDIYYDAPIDVRSILFTRSYVVT